MNLSDDLQEPRAMVVFESMFGNTELVARAVADGLRAEGVPTRVAEVSAAPADLPPSVELLVVGAPTHAFSLRGRRRGSRPCAKVPMPPRRRSGCASGSRPSVPHRPTCACRGVRHARHEGTAAAGRRRTERRSPGQAARFARVDRPVAFLVDDLQGPLVDGELDRATSWGRSLAAMTRSAAR